MLFTHLYFRQEEKQKAGLHLQQADNKLLNLFFFSWGVAIKLAVLGSLHTTPVSLC